MAVFVSGLVMFFAGALLLEAGAQNTTVNPDCSAGECFSSMINQPSVTTPTPSLLPSSTTTTSTSVSASSQFSTLTTSMTSSASLMIISSTPTPLQSPTTEETTSSPLTSSTIVTPSTLTAQPGDTPSTSSPTTDDGIVDPNNPNNDFINSLLTIIIICSVMAFLLLVICILMTAVVVLCQRSIGAKRRQKRRSKVRQRKPSPMVQVVETSTVEKQKPTSPGADSKNKALQSPEKKQDLGSISDVSLLCRVLQDYDPSQHKARITHYARSSVASSSSYYDSPVHSVRTAAISLTGMSPAHYDSPRSTRFPSNTSNDLEASIKTQMSYLSQDDSADYDELEKIIVSLEEQVEQLPSPPITSENLLSPVKTPTKSPQPSPSDSPPKSPPKSPHPSPHSPPPKSPSKSHTRHAPSVAVVLSPKPPRSPLRSQEMVDDFGYQVIDTDKIGQSQTKKDVTQWPNSANDIFDDPKYTVPIVPSQSGPELYPIPEDAQSSSRAGVHQPNTDQSRSPPTLVVDRKSYPTFSPCETAKENGEKLPFLQKEFKQYMSLHQVLELVEKKMSPSREPSAESKTETHSENGSEDSDIGDLYCPRVVMPPPAVANTSN